MVQQLKAYKEQYGDYAVPTHYPENQALTKWVQALRAEHAKRVSGDDKSRVLTDDRYQSLTQLGFGWRLKVTSTGDEDDWDARFQELLLFKEQHGHTIVPQQYPPNPSLGFWVATMRRKYREMKEGKRLRALNRRTHC